MLKDAPDAPKNPANNRVSPCVETTVAAARQRTAESHAASSAHGDLKCSHRTSGPVAWCCRC
jgi:hypothetical protein